MSTQSQRLDTSRKRIHDLEQTLSAVHIAAPYIPAPSWSALEALIHEAYDPSRTQPQLGTHITSSDPHTLRSNRAAIREIEAFQAWHYRWATQILGGSSQREDTRGYVGRLELIVYGRSATHTPLARSAGA